MLSGLGYFYRPLAHRLLNEQCQRAVLAVLMQFEASSLEFSL